MSEIRNADRSLRVPDFTALGRWVEKMTAWSDEMAQEVRRLEESVAEAEAKEEAAHEERDKLAEGLAEDIADVNRGILTFEELAARYGRQAQS
jgi:hypothetical protein